MLVETKMAAVPSIASDCCYNAGIVEDGVDGVVLKECSASSLRDAVSVLSADPSHLDEIKRAALVSAERFYIDRYVGMIVSELAE